MDPLRDPCRSLPQVAPPTADEGHTCGEDRVLVTDDHFLLSCKSFWPQHCSVHTELCGRVGSGGGAQQPPLRCFCTPAQTEAGGRRGVVGPPCERTGCCDPRLHHRLLEDTFAAGCQVQAAPAPSQLLPHLQELAPPLTLGQASAPRLISSLSETGLDAKHLLPCCSLGSSWISTLSPTGPPQQCGPRTSSRDTGTMTVPAELKDVGVQVGESVAPHVFPQICLAETSPAPGPKPRAAQRSPVKEVKWDAEGMTWEVYGASVDPEELGSAIQRHLELQIKETASHAAKVSLQKTNASQQKRRTRSSVMGFIRSPACCVRTSTAVD